MFFILWEKWAEERTLKTKCLFFSLQVIQAEHGASWSILDWPGACRSLWSLAVQPAVAQLAVALPAACQPGWGGNGGADQPTTTPQNTFHKTYRKASSETVKTTNQISLLWVFRLLFFSFAFCFLWVSSFFARPELLLQSYWLGCPPGFQKGDFRKAEKTCFAFWNAFQQGFKKALQVLLKSFCRSLSRMWFPVIFSSL